MKFLLIVTSFILLSTIIQAQVPLNFTKHVYRNYKPAEEIKSYCNENYSIVYLKANSKGKIEIISSADSLGKLIVPGLSFLKGYDIKKSNTTLGLFFVLQNIEFCTGSERGFNETSEIIDNLIKVLGEKQNSVQFIYYPFLIKTGFNVH